MRFSESKAATLRPQKEKGLSTFLIALISAAAIFVPFMIMGDGYFTFFGDFNVQQIPFYQTCHKAIREGNFFWNTTTDLGANFVGSYSFYLLGSPFFWLTIPFPNSFVPYLMGPLLILKFACAALTAYFFIRRFTRTPRAARLGGLLYAFSGFSVYNIFFNHFHEAIIVFPLLLLSLELLITENRRFGFAIMVCVCAITNYFFFFGMVVFCVIYFFVRLFMGAVKVKLSTFVTLGFEAIIGLLMASVLLLPSILAISGNNRVDDILLGWDAIMYGKEQIYANIVECFFFPPDIPARPVFFPYAEVRWSSLGGWLPVFSTVGLFVWFSQKKKNWLKTLFGICIFMAMVPFLNAAFYAFNDCYYARWFYMPILLMCLATVVLTEDSKIDWRPGYKWVAAITVVATLVVGLFPQRDENGKIILGLYTQDDRALYKERFWFTAIVAIAGLVILGFLLKLLKTDRKRFYQLAVVAVCIISVIYSNYFLSCGRYHSFEVKEIVIDQLIEGEVDLGDEDNFRIDVYDGVDNTSMYLGYQGINAFHSVVPTSIFDFYDYVGVERSVGSRPEVDDYALRPLLSVKYLLNSRYFESFEDKETGATLMPGYKYYDTQNNYYIYENENYIPYGFSYEYYMTKEFCDTYVEKDRPAMMLKAILLNDEQIKKYGYMLKNIETDEDIDYYSDEETSLACTYETLALDSKKLAQTSAESFKFDNNGFTAKVSRDKENLVFFSIPYEEGWSATVNGKPVEIERVNVGFMAVKVDAGVSEIRFNYNTPGLFGGLTVTLISAGIFLIYIIVIVLMNKKKRMIPEYPEGEQFLRDWKLEELRDRREEMIREREQNKPSLLDCLPDITPTGEPQNFTDGFQIENESPEDDKMPDDDKTPEEDN